MDGRATKEIQPQNLCIVCNKNWGAKAGLSKNGRQRYHSKCHPCQAAQKPKYQYRQHKKNYCERCNWIPEESYQLEVDHIDGNNRNNDLSNLQTLCMNCHQLKTFLSMDHLKGDAKDRYFEEGRPKCIQCGVKYARRQKNGPKYSKKCQTCYHLTYKKFSWKSHKKECCERCNFIPENSCQLSVDHIDGNKKNNELNNLQTLCVRCHKLKTIRNKDWDKRK
jgi:5-methylcytosine-specific restriction endonuclease McrA